MVRYDERREGWGEVSERSRCKWLSLREYLDKLSSKIGELSFAFSRYSEKFALTDH